MRASAMCRVRRSVLAEQFERERTWRCGRFRPGRMGDDRVRDGVVSSEPRVHIEHLLAESVRDGVRDSAGVYEDALVR